MTTPTVHAEPETALPASRRPLAERLATNPDGVLDEIARDYGVSTLDVVKPFFNGKGEAMYKVFVRGDETRNLVPEQVAAFEALRATLA